MAISSYNSTIHKTTGMTPYEAMYGRPAVTIADVVAKNSYEDDHDEYNNLSMFVRRLQENAQQIHAIIENNTREAQRQQKSYYDKFAKGREIYKINDLVKVPNPIKNAGGKVGAFDNKFYGPYRITRILGDLTYEVMGHNNRLRTIRVHYNKLSRYEERKH
jgi:hypothetical protein